MPPEQKTNPPHKISLRRRFLQALAVMLYRHPALIMFIVVLLTILSAHRIFQMEYSSSLRVNVQPDMEEEEVWSPVGLVFPPHSPVTVQIQKRDEDAFTAEERELIVGFFRSAFQDDMYVSRLVLVEERHEDASIDYSEILTRLRPRDFQRLQKAVDPADGLINTLQMVDEQIELSGGLSQESLDAVAEDPFGILDALGKRGQTEPGNFPHTMPHAAIMQNTPDTIMMVLYPTQSSSEIYFCDHFEDFLENTVTAFRDRHGDVVSPVRVHFYGRHLDTAKMGEGFRKDIFRVTLILGICLLLLMILAFRKMESLILVFLPPLVGWFWTYGMVSLFTDRLGLISGILPFVLIALGVEFVIQIYHRFTEELYLERRYYPALGAAYAESGRGIFVATLVTCLIFLSLFLSPFRELRQFALVGTLGSISMALAALIMLPPMAAIKSWLARGKVQPLETFDFGLGNLSYAVVGSPRTALSIGLLLTVYLGYHARSIEVNQDIGLDMTAAQTMEQEFSKRKAPKLPYKKSPITIMIEGNSLQEALAYNDILYHNLLDIADEEPFGAVKSLSAVMPGAVLQSLIRTEIDKLDLYAIDRSLTYVAEVRDLDRNHFRPFIQVLRQLKGYIRYTPIIDISEHREPEVFPLAQRMIVRSGHSYRVLTQVFPLRESKLLEPAGLDAFRQALQKQMPDYSVYIRGEILQNQKVAETVIYSLALMVFLALLSLVICLVPHFRWALWDPLLASIPAFCAVFWTLGLMSITGSPISLYSMLVLPVVVGLSVSQSILFIQRLYDREYATLRQVVRTGGRPIIISCISLVLGLGCLLQVRFQPLREMASVLLIAVVSMAVATLILLPAILQIRHSGGLSGWEGD